MLYLNELLQLLYEKATRRARVTEAYNMELRKQQSKLAKRSGTRCCEISMNIFRKRLSEL